MSERGEKIIAMRGFCDVSSPDSFVSPGADWLYNLYGSAEEAWESGRFGADSGEDRESVIHELAGSAVPSYTHNSWLVFTDLQMYDTDAAYETEKGENSSGTEWAGVVLYGVARTGLTVWLDDKISESECGECGCFPCECDDDDDDDVSGDMCGACGTDREYCVCCKHCGKPFGH